MDGYTTDYINLIADNLRDRYDNGFPILKELIQNADDAKARTFVFAHHPGFPDAAHPLLNGPGFWFFNDGEFKPSDAQALCAFGINSKAGDASAIGKFGLGMKSVFHLCEAIFYLAWDGQSDYRRGLNPWKQDGQDPHPEWDQVHAGDWDRLEALAKPLVREEAESWFLLWVPLRRKEHVRSPLGDEIPISPHYPGDDPHPDLDFLDEPGLPLDLAEILPLLKHLEGIEHRGERNAFVLGLEADQRLLGERMAERSSGKVVFGDSGQSLRFAGLGAEDQDPNGTFAKLKARGEWPRSRYRDERRQEQQAPDKTSPEAAVLFCSAPALDTRSDLHWAVFLPVEQGGERLKIDAGHPGHSLILHGQFFIDAGRKKPHELEKLHLPPEDFGAESIDDSLLRRTWNQHLAQRVLMPLVIPALEHYAADSHLSDVDSAALTRALGRTQWFRDFASHICYTAAWVRVMEPDAEPGWRRAHGRDLDRLRPLPTPPKSDPQRPWHVFPRLKSSGLLPFDVTAPSLSNPNRSSQWKETEVDDLLSEVTGLFTDGPRIDYLADFLASCAGPVLNTGPLQQRLIALLRTGLIAASRDGRRQHAEKSCRVIGFVEPTRRLMLAAELPEPVLRGLWGIDSPILLIPRGLEPELVSTPETSEGAWAAWLRVLDRHLAMDDAEADQQAVLDVVADLIRRLSADTRGRFLRVHKDLRIIAIRDARTGRNRAVSGAEIRAVREAGTLFGFAQGTQDRERLGLTPLLAAVLPDSRIWLVRADRYRDLFPNEAPLPAAGDKRSCLAAIGRDDSGRLGSLKDRREFLKEANDPGTDQLARQGLRFLLHGCADHRRADGQPLWFPGHNQHPVWAKLWGRIHTVDRWSLVPSELAETVPQSGWSMLDVREIGALNLLGELARPGAGIPVPTDFDPAEREEILSKIEDQGLWQRLPLHTTVTGEPVSALNERVYLAPEGGAADDPLTREATLIARSLNRTVANQQRDWLKPLNHRAIIELGLSALDQSVHWRAVLDALSKLATEPDPDLEERLSRSAWLPMADGRPVKPQDVIELPGGMADQARRLVAEHRAAHGPYYAVASDLDPALTGHPAWSDRGRGLCASGEIGLKQLGLLLADLEEYRIGPWRNAPEDGEIALLSDCSHLPGWQLLKLAQAPSEGFDGQTAWLALRDGLAQPLKSERLFDVLDWLSRATTDWSIRKGVFDRCLGWLMETPGFARLSLRDLRLASADRRWQPADRLCAGAHGIDSACLVDSRQAEILVSVIRRADTGPAEADGMATQATRTDFDAALRTSKETLAAYFKPWEGGWVPEPMIGLVLGVLGYRELASVYLHARPLDLLFSEVPWVDPGGDSMHRNWMHGFSRDQLMEKIQVAVRVLSGDCTEVPNLLGDWINVPIAQEAKSLLVGGIQWMGGYRALLQLRRVDPGALGEAQLGLLLRAMAETLYAGLYNQPPSDFQVLWQDLSRSDQVQVRVARRLILDHALLYLRQFPTDQSNLKTALARCDDWRHRVAEVEDKGRDAGRDAGREWQGQRRSVEDLTRLIDQDQTIAAAILAGVCAKLKQYQYDQGSIPFELFQNADDAAVELGQMEAHPGGGCTIPPGARRVVVESDDAGLRLMHWGRPINARGPAGFNGEARGFGRDLEKMLILSASDKQPGQGVTGKFGLGFKSVLLACERPRILSGRLAFEVIAGILPEPWADTAAARGALNRQAPPELRGRGTLIELPGIDQGARGRILDRFRALAGVLCIFARAVRKIDLFDCSSRQPFDWEPTEIAPGVEQGRLRLRDGGPDGWGAQTEALCLRTDPGAVLLALGPGGFRLLPKDTPSLWVTAPLRETDGLGFACTAPFDLDAGRARLAGDSQHNLGVAQRLGAAVGELLGTLFDRGRSDWPGLRRDLGLAEDLEPHDLWQSLWTCLTEHWRNRQDGAASLTKALGLFLLKRLSARPKAVPNGLAAPLRALVDLCEARYQLDKSLASPRAIATLSAWERFAVRYPRQHVVSEAIGRILREGDMARPANLGLSALVALIDPAEVTPEDALALGGLHLLPEDDRGWRDDDLKRRLRALRFRTAADTWVESARLVSGGGQGIEKDETLRHAFAPPARRLHPSYWLGGDGAEAKVAFFILVREGLQADAPALAGWALAADTPELRRAALVYLSDGDLGQRVAEQVKTQAWLPDALHDQALVAGLNSTQMERLRGRLASASQLQQIWQPPIPPRPLPPTLDLGTALTRIADWWKTARVQEEPKYRQDLFPPGDLDLGLDEEGRIRDRPGWFTLFAIAAFQTIPRTQGRQHLGFLRKCKATHCQGEDCAGETWWQVFSERDPTQYPEKWMGIIEQYAEAQHDDEEWTQWIGQFPKLYRLRRWIDDYVDLFLSIDRFNAPFPLDLLLAPKVNPHFQGGGIEAPPLTRTLRVGGPLVIRELLQRGVITNPLAVPHAYAPIQRIRDWFAEFDELVETSKGIHDLLCKHLGEAATFDSAYDIPLRLVTGDEDLQRRLFSP